MDKHTMTTKQAYKKAVAIWGKNACVEKRREPTRAKSGAVLTGRCVVGKVVMGMFFSIEGEGGTFEEAFANYEMKKQKDHERYLAAMRKP